MKLSRESKHIPKAFLLFTVNTSKHVSNNLLSRILLLLTTAIQTPALTEHSLQLPLTAAVPHKADMSKCMS